MQDVSEIFKKHFNLLHKGTFITKSVQDRKEVHNNARKTKRDTLAFMRRNIDENLSPVNTPTPRKSVIKAKNIIEKTSQLPEKNTSINVSMSANLELVSKRLELLRKWKADKEKQKNRETSKAKPIFKICHVSSDLSSDIENANKLIKGKPIIPGSASKQSQFAPPNHKFRPPKGIKALSFNISATQTQAFGLSGISTLTKLAGTPQQKTRTNPTSTFTKLKSTPQQKTRTETASIFTKLKSTPQQKTRNEPTNTFTKLKSTPQQKPRTESASTFTKLKSTPQQKTRNEPTNTFTKLKSPPQQKPRTESASTFTKLKSTPQQKARNEPKSTFTKVKSTPQQKTRTDVFIKKSLPEISSMTSKVGSKELLDNSRPTSAPNQNEEKISKSDTKKNLQKNPILKSSRLDKDKDVGLMEVKKSRVITLSHSKVSRNSKTIQDVKKLGSSNNISLLKKSTPLASSHPVTRITKKSTTEKTNNSIASIQKTPKKTIGFKVRKHDSGKRQSSKDTSIITSRKTPKKSEINFNNNDSENNKISYSVDAVTLDSTNEEHPKEGKNTESLEKENYNQYLRISNVESQEKDNSSSSGGFLQTPEVTKSIESSFGNSGAQSSRAVSHTKTLPNVYVSPFVTISRGKNSARKEYQLRISQDKSDFDKNTPEVKKILTAHTSPKEGATYFKRKLDLEITRITEICNTWEILLTNPNLPEEARSSIDCSIGQSKLLLSKKFQQFRCLIAQCETENYESKPVTCEDLHGFWDMIYMQVEDLEKRFANLQKLKDNNWEEILPQKAAPVKRPRGRPKKTTKSKLTQIIQEARKKQIEQQNGNTPLFNVLNEVKTPLREKLQEVPQSLTARGNLRLSLLNKKNKSRCSSSPGLTMMKISQSIKQGDGLTPARSILKSDVNKSTSKKSVAFKDNFDVSPKLLSKTNLFSELEKENISDNLINFSPPPLPLTPRRSVRISKLKV